MADAIFLSPMHPRKNVKCLAQMDQNHGHKTGRAKQLQDRPRGAIPASDRAAF